MSSEADLFANHPFNRKVEEISRQIWAPSRTGSRQMTHWFYERARAQYQTEQIKLTPAQRDALLRELFGRDSTGVGFSFTRVDMGASDFSRSHYSYDDVPPGRRDMTLSSFSIEPDRAETIPILQRALAINPQLTLMASPCSAPAWMKTLIGALGRLVA